MGHPRCSAIAVASKELGPPADAAPATLGFAGWSELATDLGTTRDHGVGAAVSPQYTGIASPLVAEHGRVGLRRDDPGDGTDQHRWQEPRDQPAARCQRRPGQTGGVQRPRDDEGEVTRGRDESGRPQEGENVPPPGGKQRSYPCPAATHRPHGGAGVPGGSSNPGSGSQRGGRYGTHPGSLGGSWMTGVATNGARRTISARRPVAA